jgi:hypothetical protein
MGRLINATGAGPRAMIAFVPRNRRSALAALLTMIARGFGAVSARVFVRKGRESSGSRWLSGANGAHWPSLLAVVYPCRINIGNVMSLMVCDLAFEFLLIWKGR